MAIKISCLTINKPFGDVNYKVVVMMFIRIHCIVRKRTGPGNYFL